MEITLVKDITYLAIAIGTTVISIVGIWFHFKHKLETHERLIKTLDEKIEKRTEVFGNRVDKMDCELKKINKKLSTIEKNLIVIMEKLGTKPVEDLFEE